MSGGVLIARGCGSVLYAPAVNLLEAEKNSSSSVKAEGFSGGIPFRRISCSAAGKKILIDSKNISCSLGFELQNRSGMKPVFKEGVISKIREIKDEGEINLIRKSCRRAFEIITELNIRKWAGRSESEMAGHLQALSWGEGFGGPSFTPVVASGINSAFPHHYPSSRKIDETILKIDFGLKFSEYCSDLTRTFILDKLSKYKFFDSVYNKVSEAKEEAEKLLAPGKRCSDIYNAAAGVLEKYGLKKYFPHNLGHGIGLNVHEGPRLGPGEKSEIKPGMTLTVEPGVYMPGKGGVRIEDTYLITEKGAEKLTRKYP